jgi:hypothetical protein
MTEIFWVCKACVEKQTIYEIDRLEIAGNRCDGYCDFCAEPHFDLWPIKESIYLVRALALTKGSYQKELVEGKQTWSGSSLRATARYWANKYAKSRRNLLRRLELANVAWLAQGFRNKLTLKLGPRPKHVLPVSCAAGRAWR